ncbi:MAG: O-antigen ligase family protein [Rhodoferax sp.]|uniref:O-antigen ligase family protein n=1 Tax=Rhodoferax sp. TaxID=50421 RepID=UPI002ACD68E6|nr:O-antigen ligase family protein [Rhodoferax sp.]MDZ7891344.1 O-antigen ligase family protein [Rhodoferax sp.]
MTALSYAIQSAPYLAAILLGLLIPIVILYLHRSFNLGLILISTSFLVDTWTLGGAAINLGVNLFFADAVFLLIGFSVLTRFFLTKPSPTKNVAWYIFAGLVLVSTLSGIATFGSSAGVQARSYFYFIVAASYAMTFSMDDRKLGTVYKFITIIACVLISIAIYRWVVYYLPILALLPPGGSYNIDGPIRVIYSNHALVIAQIMVGSFFFSNGTPAFANIRLFSPLLLGMVVVLQHRSVWVAAFSGIMVRFLLGKTKAGTATSQFLLVLAIAALTAVPLIVSDKLSGVTAQISNSATGAMSGGGTGGERLESWGELVKKWYGAGPRSILIGQSFGSDSTRTVTNSRGETKQISYIAHNLYIQTLFNTGLLGLATYLTVALYVLIGLYRICRTKRDNLHAEILFVALVIQHVYYIPYGVDYLQAIIFGIALAYVADNRILSKKEQRHRALSKGTVL